MKMITLPIIKAFNAVTIKGKYINKLNVNDNCMVDLDGELIFSTVTQKGNNFLEITEASKTRAGGYYCWFTEG